jgi:hypothetical protein
MAGANSIASVGRSLRRLLNDALSELPVPVSNAEAFLVRTESFESDSSDFRRPALTIYLYRIDFNKATRAAWSAVGSRDGQAHLPLDLHYLVTAWAANAEDEHRILGCAMQRLESMPVLAGPLLTTDGGWAPNEAVQLVLGEMSTEELMRTFDSLPGHYHLTVPYLARVVRLDARRLEPGPRVDTAIAGLTAGTRP